jgi:hypothetical protein
MNYLRGIYHAIIVRTQLNITNTLFQDNLTKNHFGKRKKKNDPLSKNSSYPLSENNNPKTSRVKKNASLSINFSYPSPKNKKPRNQKKKP